MPYSVHITDTVPGARLHEPIRFTVAEQLEGDLWLATTSTGQETVCQRLRSADAGGTSFVATVSFEREETLALQRPLDALPVPHPRIRELSAREDDAFVRLDTGWFDLEMCTGTARGTGASKWGLRHFAATADGVDLLPSGNNAIGGFYGPFFTPENGLINPPEHTTVTIEVVEKGPVLHHYRMHGTVPDGRLAELRGKTFSIDWTFTAGTPYFHRRYRVDPFETTINGRAVTDKITVGDEFEGGAGELVFDRFAAYGGTRFRAGDPYAAELAAMVDNTLKDSTETGARFAEFRRQLTGDLGSAHWDLYWRLFCTWEQALGEAEATERLAAVMRRSHRLADHPTRSWTITTDPVDVDAVDDETIFPGPSSKTVEFSTDNSRAMIWWTSQPSGAFQIVQRRASGWVNWGSNGENECPELPTGCDIKTAWRSSAVAWEAAADQLETPPLVSVSSA